MNCDRLARHYQWIEFATFGGVLESRRRRYLPELASARRALVLGDGDGRFLCELLAANPHVHADYIDLSAAMLDRARKRIDAALGRPGTSRVTYHHADALAHPLPARTYDAVATHFFLDCFEPPGLAALIARIGDAAAPGAHWVISEFRVPRGPLAAPARALIAAMYGFFRVATGLRTRRPTDHRPLAASAGFRLLNTSYRLREFVSSELWSMTP